MFVKSLYAIRPSYVNELKQQFQTLLTLLPADTPVYVWTDQDMTDVYHPHLHVLFSPLTAFETYNRCMTECLALPEQRTVEKDTQNYMALMNTKLEFLLRAVPSISEGNKTVAWIDCGIAKIFKDKETARKDLDRIAHHPWNLERMVVPGCWTPRFPVNRSAIWWRFAGGFFLAPTSLIGILYTLQTAQLRVLIEHQKRITWEVNVWAMMEEKAPHFFQWYKGDHDNTILQVPM
jgi:hypothetical protein